MPRPPAATVAARFRILRGEEDAFGPGKAQILESLLETGSLNRTASTLKMSYVKALALVRAMNTHFSHPLVTLSRGGKQGGGTQVTETGKKVLEEYQALRKAGEAATAPAWERLRKLIKR